LLAKDQCLLRRNLTGPIDDVGPAVSEVSHLVDLAPVVAAHIPPAITCAIVTKPTVELDVDLELLDDDIQVLAAIAQPAPLPGPGGQTVCPPQLRLAQLERGVRACAHIRQGFQHELAPPSLGQVANYSS
jgi:hypothetical protein